MNPKHIRIRHRYGGASHLHQITSTAEIEDAVNWLEKNGTEVERVEIIER